MSAQTACIGMILGGAALGAAPAAAESNGSLSVGWREVWLSGDEAKYRQHVNLDDGPRLFDARFAWTAEERGGAGGALAPDRVAFELSALGGDPYEDARLSVERAGHYRFRYRRQESEYFYDDILVLPENASIEGSTGGDFRRFDFERVRDRAELSVEVSPRTVLNLGFDRYHKRGDATTVMDVEREEFDLERPVDETMEMLEAGISHQRETVTLAAAARRRTFDYASEMFLPGASEGSDPEAPTELDFFFLDQPYDLETLEGELSMVARPADRLQVSATVLDADVDVDLHAAERSVGLDFTGAPFERELTGSGDVSQDRRLYDLGTEYTVNERMGVFARLRVVELDQSGSSDFDGAGASDWSVDTRRLEAGTDLALARTLRLSLGWSGAQRDVSMRQVVDDTTAVDELDSDASGYFARLTWRPSSRALLRASLADDGLDDAYSAALPTDSRRYRLEGRYRWESGWSVSASWQDSERRNDDTGWHADAERTNLRLGYVGTRLTVSAGLSRIDLSRSVDSLVIAGFREALFAIDYGARADSGDLAVSWRLGPRLTLGGSLRRYDNDGSFGVERDDLRAFLRGAIGDGYRWGLEYRNVDFAEGAIEAFDADIVELRAGLDW